MSEVFTSVPEAIEDIRAGRMLVVIDDEARENEGDLTLAAERVTPETINFMAKHGRGLICLAMTGERLDHLRIGPMTEENTAQYGTAFCEAIDARDGVLSDEIVERSEWNGLRTNDLGILMRGLANGVQAFLAGCVDLKEGLTGMIAHGGTNDVEIGEAVEAHVVSQVREGGGSRLKGVHLAAAYFFSGRNGK